MTRKGCAECTQFNSILDRGLPGRNLYSLEPAAPKAGLRLDNSENNEVGSFAVALWH